jgi:sugar transferase (PEP-CTERM/EpsH1 system associated)
VRILALSTAVPFPPDDGGRMRVYELLRGLAANHEVELLTLTGGSDEERDGEQALANEGVPVTSVPHHPSRARSAATALLRRRSLNGGLVLSKAMAARLEERLSRGDVDVVQCEYTSMVDYRTDGRVPWVLDAQNVEFRINARLAVTASGPTAPLYRMYGRREAHHRRAEEVRQWRRADHVVAVSDTDRGVMTELVPEAEITVVPNCIDPHRFAPSPRPHEERRGAVFVGKMDYRPNVDAMVWFVDGVLPLVRSVVPDFELTIVGRDPVPRVQALGRRPGVRIVGRVRETLPYLHAAALEVVPLRAGSGSRLKVLEALATGTPVITTELGVEGLTVDPGRHVVVAEHPIEMADAIVDLMADPARRQRLADDGRRLVEERYAWPDAVRRLAEVHEQVVAKHRSDRG